jgi:uncharacterized protein YbbC (DUF1343 family)/CubicO group peptidase (beta-lactamase class C family)
MRYANRFVRFSAALLLVFLVSACASIAPSTRNLDRASIAAIDSAIEEAIAGGKTIGGVFFIESGGDRYGRTFGLSAVEPERTPALPDTIYDMASLTKVAATAPSVMLLVERGRIDVDAPVKTYIPEMADPDITVRHLLTHTSALKSGLSLAEPWSGYDEGIRRAAAELPTNRPGHIFRYSDINFILLGEVVRRASGLPLHEFARREIYEPLGMRDTGFLPAGATLGRVAPTERVEGEGLLRGVVHDPTSRRMGGVAGHAGLFSTVDDLRRYVGMILNGGALDGVRVMKPETVQLMISDGTPPNVGPRRSLGWDLETMYSRLRGDFPFGSFGHTGYTGPTVWIDPASQSFYIFLTNRVHPDGKGNINELRADLGRLVSHAVLAADYATNPKPRRITPLSGGSARNGIDVVMADGYQLLKGKRIGLITNHTGRDGSGNYTIEILRSAPGVELVALFSPEHGIRGELDETIGDTTDPFSGLPVYSLYGERRAPSPEQLQGLDALVFDIQDIGARFYTYISTMGLSMEAAAKAGVKFIVLDRVNPITGALVEGPADVQKQSFTAWHTIAVRHGMTVGELARMFNDERAIGADLDVVPVRGWTRDRWYDETGLPWVNTSPNIRNLTAATLYPGVCILERTRLSMGRGTPMPFEWVGAPWVDGEVLARELNAAAPAGVRFHPMTQTPNASLYAGESCGGVRIELLDRDRLNALELGAVLSTTLYGLYPERLEVEKIDVLLQHPPTLEAIRQGEPAEAIQRLWAPTLESFLERRARYLIYK